MGSLKKDLEGNIKKNFDNRDFTTYKKSEMVSAGTRINPDDMDRLKKESAEKGLSVSALIRMILREHIK